MQPQPIIKTAKQIAAIRESGKYLNELLLLINEKAKAGTATIELEFVAEHFIKTHNLKGAFKHYKGFPANLCLSVNDCVVHGEPSDYILKNGDLLKIDAGLIYNK
jgi:methionyl aminopeptidase